MEEVAPKGTGNGTGMPGNVIGAISKEAMDEVESARCADFERPETMKG